MRTGENTVRQIDLIIQRIEHTMQNEDELRSVEALRSCLEDIYRIAAGKSLRRKPSNGPHTK